MIILDYTVQRDLYQWVTLLQQDHLLCIGHPRLMRVQAQCHCLVAFHLSNIQLLQKSKLLYAWWDSSQCYCLKPVLCCISNSVLTLSHTSGIVCYILPQQLGLAEVRKWSSWKDFPGTIWCYEPIRKKALTGNQTIFP